MPDVDSRAALAEGSSPVSTQALCTRGTVEAALRRAFSLGQTYWQQADSVSYSQQLKSDATRAKFNALVAETLAALEAAK